jgi:hypothetical protein
MKKNALILIVFCCLYATNNNAQVNTNRPVNNNITDENAFIDASTNFNDANSLGKGLIFPRTNLTTWQFKTDALDGINFPTAFDGMIVYNTATGSTLAGQGIVTIVTPGFYYFSNPSGSDSITTGTWQRISSGSALLSGASSPSNLLGSNGDFYINTTTNTIYGPKTAGSWPAGNSLVGATGPQGATGATGADGLSAYQIWLNAGNTGSPTQFLAAIKGDTGATGATGPQGAAGVGGVANAGSNINITGAGTVASPYIIGTSFTPENVANKVTTLANPNDITYPTTKAVSDALDTKQSTLTNPITGTGTTNFLSKFTGTGTLGNSAIFEVGGNVGIGTSSPTSKFEIANIPNTPGSSNFHIGYGANGDNYFTSGVSGIQVFRTDNAERMRLDASGNLGIGTATPGATLDVNGNFKVGQYLSFSSTQDLLKEYVNLITNVHGDVLLSSNLYNSDTSNELFVAKSHPTIKGAAIRIKGNSSDTGDIQFWTTPYGAATEDAPYSETIPTMLLKNNKNVGIGTSSPTSYLQVAGAIATSITSIASNTTLNATHSTVVCNTATAGFTVTLPAASSCTGREYTICRKDQNTTNVLSFSTPIYYPDGVTNFTTTNIPNAVFVLQSDGANWIVIK